MRYPGLLLVNFKATHPRRLVFFGDTLLRGQLSLSTPLPGAHHALLAYFCAFAHVLIRPLHPKPLIQHSSALHSHWAEPDRWSELQSILSQWTEGR